MGNRPDPKFLQDPIMGIAYAMPEAIRGILSFWVGILAVTILIIAANAGILGLHAWPTLWA